MNTLSRIGNRRPQTLPTLGWLAARGCLAVCAGLVCVLLLPSALIAQDRLSKDSIRKQLGLQKSISCSTRTSFPVLLFDFRIHSPYRVIVPLKQVKDSKQLTVRTWTVALKDANGRKFEEQRLAHFSTYRFRMSDFSQSGNRLVQLDGSIATGAGEYRHFLAIDDGEGLGCVKEWKVKAKTSRQLLPELALAPGEATDPRLTAFTRQKPVPKNEHGIRVAVVLNADNRSWSRVLTDSGNMIALAAAVRRVAEDERVREVALTVLSLHDQNVLFEHSYREVVDFRRLGGAFRQLKPGRVDLKNLTEGSEAEFLANVLREREDMLAEADLVLFLGARSPVTDKVPPSTLEVLQPKQRKKVAYLVTNPFRWKGPLSRDVIGHAVRALGGMEKDIRLPGDLPKAINQVVSESLPKHHVNPAQ
jgi:hypothetical protein